MSPHVLLLDDAAAVNDLFARLLRSELGVDVTPMASVAQLESELARGTAFDVALVDLSFPEERRTGMEALLMLHLACPGATLGVITQGDSYVAQLMRDVWELLPIGTIVSKAAPIDYQLSQIRTLIATGEAPVDPSVQPLLPSYRSPQRTLAAFDRLVTHLGHAKLWRSLLDADVDVSYRDVAEATGLRLNTVKNYRSQLLPELFTHGLYDPSLREMKQFADRCKPILERRIEQVLQRSAGRAAQ